MDPNTLYLHVADACSPHPLIRVFRLKAEAGTRLPPFDAGAHLRVQVMLADGTADWRQYSLINFAPVRNATAAPTEYVIAVRKETGGRGGSRFMHEQLQVGDRLLVERPRNDFALHAGPGGTVLMAGGIGVTPLASMAARRRAEGAPVQLYYAGASRAAMAFLPELQALLGDALHVHADDERGGPLDIAAVLDAVPAGDRLYVCGPKPMLDAVLAQTQARGWDHDRVHFELFNAPAAQEGDQPFEIELAQSGQHFTVAADQSILDCLIAHGCDPIYDCNRGECGVCAVPVLAGEIDHRDYVLSAREKAAGNVIQVCISRAAPGARLVLDI